MTEESKAGETPGPMPTLDSLLFPSAQTSISQTLASLRRSALSISNRLQSIETDAAFVREVAEHFELPLVANERCGSWYINPEHKAGSAYFKSTDGHTGQWDFSFRRLNMQLLPLAREYGGCVIVDSTRRGKCTWITICDARCIIQNNTYLERRLKPRTFSHRDRISPRLPTTQLPRESEESQIESRIDNFVASLKNLKLDLEHLRTQLGKPIRIAWANRSYFYPTDLHKSDAYCLFVLCSASRRVQGAEISQGGYIQGAGDDSEGWAHGLTPPIFWEHRALLKSTPEEELPGLIGELIAGHAQSMARDATLIAPTKNLFIGAAVKGVEADLYDLVIDCNGDPAAMAGVENPKRLNLGCASAKLGSRDLRKSLDRVRDFVAGQLAGNTSRSLLVTCETGKDLSAGALLAIICLFYNDEGEFDISQGERSVGKQYIRQRLAWIVSSKHDVNPSRSTLQSVNAFLMS